MRVLNEMIESNMGCRRKKIKNWDTEESNEIMEVNGSADYIFGWTLAWL